MYFITLGAQSRNCTFGRIINDNLRPSGLGLVVTEEWLATSAIRTEIELGSYVLMPNHLHAIIVIRPTGASTTIDFAKIAEKTATKRGVKPAGPAKRSLSALVAGYKSAVTRRHRVATGDSTCLVWQRNYYEHVIRDDNDLTRIENYIAGNPRHWTEDEENPRNR